MKSALPLSRRGWTDAEVAYLRRWYRRGKTAAQIAAHLSCPPQVRTLRQVHNKAGALGLHVTQKFRAPDMVAFIRARNAAGWSDSEIARARGVDRHAVSHVRRGIGLGCNARSARVIEKVRQRTAEQCARAGVATLGALRSKVFRERARAAGWPEDLRPRCVDILNALWERGPMTRPEVCAAIGLPWHGSRTSMKSNDVEGTYLGHLVRRGLVTVAERAYRPTSPPRGGKGRNQNVYSLSIWVERRAVPVTVAEGAAEAFLPRERRSA